MSTFDSTKKRLADLLRDVESGKTQLPDFQRGRQTFRRHFHVLVPGRVPEPYRVGRYRSRGVDPQEKRGPVKVLRIEDVSASIFRRELQSRGELRTFFTVAFSRSYKDASGMWKYSKSFDLEDLGKIIALCQQADEYIRGQLNEVQEAA